VRAVVDNNLWVSAILTRRGNPGRVLDAFMEGRFTLVTSEPLLEELAEVLDRPRIARHSRFTRAEVRELIASMRVIGEMVPVTGSLSICRDPKDDVVIETAVAGRADMLASGDRDLANDPTIAAALAGLGCRVLTAAQFAQELAKPTS
jgi:putative PIN family toxin of toxin-antitoxin system